MAIVPEANDVAHDAADDASRGDSVDDAPDRSDAADVRAEVEESGEVEEFAEVGPLNLPLSPVRADRVRLLTVGATVASALVLLLASGGGLGVTLPVALALGLVLAWAWPVLGGSFTPNATSVVLAISAVAILPTALRHDLRWTAAAVAFGVVLSFSAQLMRRTGREDLVLTLLASFGGLVPLASVTTAVVLVDDSQGRAVLVVAMAAAVCAVVADLFAGVRRLAAALGLVALAASMAGAAVVVLVASSVGTWAQGVGVWSAVGIGAAVGTVSWSFRRVFVLQPAMVTARGQIAVGVGSVLLTGALVRIFALVS